MYSFSPAINLHNLTNFILLLLFDQSLKTHNIFIPSKSFFHKHWKYQYTASFQQQSLYYFYCFHKTLKFILILQPQSYFSCYAYLPTTHNLTRQPKTWPILCRTGEPPHSRSSSQARVTSGKSLSGCNIFMMVSKYFWIIILNSSAASQCLNLFPLYYYQAFVKTRAETAPDMAI